MKVAAAHVASDNGDGEDAGTGLDRLLDRLRGSEFQHDTGFDAHRSESVIHEGAGRRPWLAKDQGLLSKRLKTQVSAFRERVTKWHDCNDGIMREGLQDEACSSCTGPLRPRLRHGHGLLERNRAAYLRPG